MFVMVVIDVNIWFHVWLSVLRIQNIIFELFGASKDVLWMMISDEW